MDWLKNLQYLIAYPVMEIFNLSGEAIAKTICLVCKECSKFSDQKYLKKDLSCLHLLAHVLAR
jgi:hypothetical protein